MAKFKVGDKVSVIKRWYGAEVGDVLEILEIESDGSMDLLNRDTHRTTATPFTFKNDYLYIENLVKSWDSLEVGDILISNNAGQEAYDRVILGITPTHIMYIGGSRLQRILFTRIGVSGVLAVSRKDAPNLFKIKGADVTPEQTELTLDEIAAKFNIPVRQIRIKD